jgi:hypothetical protein
MKKSAIITLFSVFVCNAMQSSQSQITSQTVDALQYVLEACNLTDAYQSIETALSMTEADGEDICRQKIRNLLNNVRGAIDSINGNVNFGGYDAYIISTLVEKRSNLISSLQIAYLKLKEKKGWIVNLLETNFDADFRTVGIKTDL